MSASGGTRRYLIPDIITLTALATSFESIISAAKLDFELSSRLFFLALFLDYLDGAVARLLNAKSSHGEMLDRFTDRINQCVAPAILLSMRYGSIAQIPSILLIIAGAIRISMPKGERYFNGAPIFIPALLIETPALGGIDIPIPLILLSIVMTVIPLRYPRSKETAGSGFLWNLRFLPPLLIAIAPHPFVDVVCTIVAVLSLILLFTGPFIYKNREVKGKERFY
ncbi:MAG: CDP-alcohol phosphatidyltransferase family protein [Candidatus Methanodesulfokora sp.]